MRILFFLPNLGGGGAERNMVNLANGLNRLGFEVTFGVGRGGVWGAELEPGIDVVEYGVDRALACLPGLVKTLNRIEPDWVFSTMGYANVVAIWSALLADKRPKVAVREACAVVDGSALEHLVQEVQFLVYPLADLVLALSEGLCDEFNARGLRARLLSNPTLVPEVYTGAAEPFVWPRPYALAVGRLTHAKGFDVLLRAWSEEPLPDHDLLILGDGPLRKELEDLAADLGIGSCVRFLGFQDNPYKFMANSRVYVLSSRREGMPNALIQAMACGARVVATDCPTGPRELLGNSDLGVLVAPNDPHALAQGIKEAAMEAVDQRRVMERLKPYSVEGAAAELARYFRSQPGAEKKG